MSAAARPDVGGEVLSFRLGGDRFSLPAGDVAEIIRPRAVTRVPHGHASLLGVLNLRGRVLPVVSLAALLGRSAAPATSAARIVVLDRGAPVGVWVDAVVALSHDSAAQPVDLEALLARDFATITQHSRTGRGAASAERPGGAPAPSAAPQQADLALIGFSLAGQEYALPLDEVVEVIVLPADVASLPRTDEAMLGVTALRGGLLPLVSLRVLLGLPADGWDRGRARIVVTRIGGGLVGLVADSMSAILRVPANMVDQVPPVLTRGRGEAQIAAICRLDHGRRLVSVLSTARLFDSATEARIRATAIGEDAQMPANAQDGAEQFVVFRLGEENYGLPIAAVDEVVRRPDELTRVPNAPAFVLGVMNLRGQVVPVIDQRQRFAVNDAERGSGRRVVIVTIDGLRAGFVVDAVPEIVSVSASELQAAPCLAADGHAVFDRVAIFDRHGAARGGEGRGGRMILLVDAKALLDRAERDVLAALGAEVAATS